MECELRRKPTTDRATLGELSVDGQFQCFTLEPSEDRDSYPAIPDGRYRVMINYSSRFNRRLPLVLDVPGRLGIRIHPGNSQADTEGCILLGTTQMADYVGNSRVACEAFQSKIALPIARGEDVWLTVMDTQASDAVKS